MQHKILHVQTEASQTYRMEPDRKYTDIKVKELSKNLVSVNSDELSLSVEAVWLVARMGLFLHDANDLTGSYLISRSRYIATFCELIRILYAYTCTGRGHRSRLSILITYAIAALSLSLISYSLLDSCAVYTRVHCV